MFKKRALASLSMLLVLAANTGCAVNRATASVVGDGDLGKVKTVYVVQAEEDGRQVNADLAKAFEKRGYTAATGPAHPPPYSEDAVVTYVDKWWWDFTMYMIELTITVRNPANDFPIATANSYHTSLTRKSQEEMAEEVVANVVAAKR